MYVVAKFPMSLPSAVTNLNTFLNWKLTQKIKYDRKIYTHIHIYSYIASQTGQNESFSHNVSMFLVLICLHCTGTTL